MVVAISILVISATLSMFYLWSTCSRILRREFRKRR
jgi:hypothetical protein